MNKEETKNGEAEDFLAMLAESSPENLEQMLQQKYQVDVPESARKTPRLSESAFTKKWPYNHTERKRRRKVQKQSRRKNRRK